LEGRFSVRHLQYFAYAITHCGAGQVFLREAEMVAAATSSTPRDFHERVRHLRFRLFPDDLDKAYLDGMARRDFKLSKTLGGWHLTGFLDIEIGTMLDTVLRNLSVPREAGDTRSPADRRMDGLEQFLKRTLEHGLPSDNGIRPHLSVVVTADASGEHAEQVRGAGADVVLPTPCPPETLLDSVIETIDARDSRLAIPPARRRLSERRAGLRGGGRREHPPATPRLGGVHRGRVHRRNRSV
jgi:hypothetical protein